MVFGSAPSYATDPAATEERRSKAKRGQSYCVVPGCQGKTLRPGSLCLDHKVMNYVRSHSRTDRARKLRAKALQERADRGGGDAV